MDFRGLIEGHYNSGGNWAYEFAAAGDFECRMERVKNNSCSILDRIIVNGQTVYDHQAHYADLKNCPPYIVDWLEENGYFNIHAIDHDRGAAT